MTWLPQDCTRTTTVFTVHVYPLIGLCPLEWAFTNISEAMHGALLNRQRNHCPQNCLAQVEELVESFPTRGPGPSRSNGRVDSHARHCMPSACVDCAKSPCPPWRACSPPVTKEPPRDWKGPPRDQSLPGTTGTQTRAGMGLSREDISRTRAHRGALCPFHPHFASLTASLDVALYGCHIAVVCAA